VKHNHMSSPWPTHSTSPLTDRHCIEILSLSIGGCSSPWPTSPRLEAPTVPLRTLPRWKLTIHPALRFRPLRTRFRKGLGDCFAEAAAGGDILALEIVIIDDLRIGLLGLVREMRNWICGDSYGQDVGICRSET
jgi:hypothetical protein